MKRKIILIAAMVVMYFVQYGLFGGLGERPALIWLLPGAAIWATFFWGTEDGYSAAFTGGILTEFVSPYAFGFAVAAFLFCFLTANFFSRKVFGNRMFYSYLLISSLSLSTYALILILGGIWGDLTLGKAAILPVELSFGAVTGALFWNLAALTAAFLATNTLTKKMHAAFIMN